MSLCPWWNVPVLPVSRKVGVWINRTPDAFCLLFYLLGRTRKSDFKPLRSKRETQTRMYDIHSVFPNMQLYDQHDQFCISLPLPDIYITSISLIYRVQQQIHFSSTSLGSMKQQKARRQETSLKTQSKMISDL